jgi:GxxExxY protein
MMASSSQPAFGRTLWLRMVEDKVMVEVKSVEHIAAVHKMQLLTYLRLADKRLGLLINFNVALIKHGITRIVNGLEEEAPSRQQG